jgi:hypothetical protein
MKRTILTGMLALAFGIGAWAQEKKPKDDCGGDGKKMAGAEC